MENINRIRILQVAHELFDTRGYRSVTIKELADKLGMSKKTIYLYFSSKEELAAAVVEETIKKLDQVINITELPKSDPLFVIKEILINVKDESMRFGPLFLMDIEKYLPNLAYRYRQFRNEKKQYLEQILKSAQELGMIRDFPIQAVTEILSVSLKALVKSEGLSQNRFSGIDSVQLFLDIFCNGIVAPSILENDTKG